MSDTIDTTDLPLDPPVESDEEKAAREAAEAEARAEADRIAEEARLEAERVAAEEAHAALVVEQTPRAYAMLEYAHTHPGVTLTVRRNLSFLDPEAVAAAREQFDAEVARIEEERKTVPELPLRFVGQEPTKTRAKPKPAPAVTKRRR